MEEGDRNVEEEGGMEEEPSYQGGLEEEASEEEAAAEQEAGADGSRRRSRASRRIRCVTNPNPAPCPRLGTVLRPPARCGWCLRRGLLRAPGSCTRSRRRARPRRFRGSILRRPVRRRRDTRLRRPGPRRRGRFRLWDR